MVKKLLFLFTFLLTSSFYAQNLEDKDNTSPNQDPVKNSISNLAAYPNPFNIKTTITFQSQIEQTVSFEVKNVLGTTVFKQKYIVYEGVNEIIFQKENLSSGMYIYSIQTNTEIVSKRLVIK